MAADIRYALIRPEAGAKPLGFPDIDALARHIQRERDTQGLDLIETEDLEIEGDVNARRGVQIYTTDAGNDRDRNLGCAWLDGRGLETLQAAIRRNRLVIHNDSQEAA